MISCKCILPSWSGRYFGVHDIILGLLSAGHSQLLLLLPLVIVDHGGASYHPVSRALGLHDICATGSSQVRTGLPPRVAFFPSLWLSRPSGYHMGQGADATGGTRMLCIGIIDQQPVALDRGPAVSCSIGGHVTAEISISSATALRSLSFAGQVMRPSLIFCSRLHRYTLSEPKRREGPTP